MLSGEDYNASDPELLAERQRCRELWQRYNMESSDAERSKILEEILGYPTDASIQAPFFCDYGYNIKLGKNVYFNVNCVVLDVTPVVIGDGVLIGPAVQIYAATHSAIAKERRSGLEFGAPVTIGEEAWIGGGSIICPGVTIGARTTIGAGSVVTKDIPPDVIAAGNPCRVIRELEAE